MKHQTILCSLLLWGAIAALAGQEIRVNQVAYYASAQKLAVVPGTETGGFELVDAGTGKVVLAGTLPEKANNWRPSGESVKLADFTALATEGSYFVRTKGASSPTFQIKQEAALGNLLRSTMKAFYFWRASTDIPKAYGQADGTGITANFARAAGHPDTNVMIHESAASEARPEGSIIASPKGWYDAGDYNKYVVNAGVSVFFLAHAYEASPALFKTTKVNIPEGGNTVPDLLDELKWEYDWLLSTQDSDGGVYFKISSAHFNPFEMPAADKLPRYAIGKSTSSALDFAAMAAMGYRLFRPYETEFPGYATTCLAAAEKAWAWAKANPDVVFKNPPGISTGEYGDSGLADEFFWAAAELFVSTGNPAYYQALDFNLNFTAPNWGYVCTNGLMSLVLHSQSLALVADRQKIRDTYQALAAKLSKEFNSSVYRIYITGFDWGSNGEVASRSAILLDAALAFKEPKFLQSGLEGLNYLLGKNPTGYCYVTGFGAKSPRHIHDRRSGADGIADPIPGYLVGGPNANAGSDSGNNAYPSKAAAKRYLDAQSSYTTNEIAINWNAPLLCLVALAETAHAP